MLKKNNSTEKEKNKSVRGKGSRWPTGVIFSYKDKRRFSKIAKIQPLTSRKPDYKPEPQKYNSTQKTDFEIEQTKLKPNKLKSNKMDISNVSSTKENLNDGYNFPKAPPSLIEVPKSIVNFKSVNLFRIFSIIIGLLALFNVKSSFFNIFAETRIIYQIFFMILQLSIVILSFYLFIELMKIVYKDSQEMTIIPTSVITFIIWILMLTGGSISFPVIIFFLLEPPQTKRVIFGERTIFYLIIQMLIIGYLYHKSRIIINAVGGNEKDTKRSLYRISKQ